MNIFKKILLISFPIYAYSYVIFDPISIDSEKVGSQCIKEIDKRYNCNLGTFQKFKKMDEVCSIHNSEKCQNILLKELYSTDGCKTNNKDEMMIYDKEFLKNYYLFNIYCSVDENNDFCSSELENLIIEFKKTYEFTFNLSNKTIQSICQSNQCINTYVKYAQQIVDLKNEIKEMYSKIEESIDRKFSDEYKVILESIEYMNSKECISIQKTIESTSYSNKLYSITNILCIIIIFLFL
ncbi:hypothetical protein PIROE2DRAFT_18701 [Piromyces sp. E2]|nr:hypothetical protein PIROE2DRAFT_18701 [Piromyces sp. E2]|eukprot:OUM56605.1 hypothetical protein PIROE2DRAFT_18701 [Piromyces sp. E2]